MQSSVDARREDAMTRSGRVREPRGEERGVLVRFLLELGEFERLQLHEAFGNATIWDFCREHLALRDGSASRRIRSARLLQQFPFIAEYLIDLRVGMTTLSILGDALTESTESNARRILDQTIGLSTRQVEALVAAAQPPEAEPATSVRRLAVAKIIATPPRLAQPTAPTGGLFDAPAAPVAETPVAEERYSINLRVGRDFIELLERAKIASSHLVPDGDVAAVLRRGLQQLVDRAEKKRRTPKRSRKVRPTSAPKSRRGVPGAIERAVRQRDDGRCQWKKPNGDICGSTWQTEIDHIVPYARGGPTTVDARGVWCRSH